MESNKEVSEEVKVKSWSDCQDQTAQKFHFKNWLELKIHTPDLDNFDKYCTIAVDLYASQFKSETTSLREENDNLRKIIHDSGNEYQARMDQQLQSIMKDANVKINELQSELERVTKENEELKKNIRQ
jgi:hypothetical protein